MYTLALNMFYVMENLHSTQLVIGFYVNLYDDIKAVWSEINKIIFVNLMIEILYISKNDKNYRPQNIPYTYLVINYD